MIEPIKVQILSGPLPPLSTPWSYSGNGAILQFDGVVRPTEEDRTIDALDYEAYEPMAITQLHRLAKSVMTTHKLLGVYVEHSKGRVNAGEVSFRLRVASRHRKEALAAMDEFIDRMKQDVPIWKSPVYATSEAR